MSLDAAPETPAERLREITRACVATSPNAETATTRLLEKVRGDAELWNALMEPFEHRAAALAVGAMIRDNRRAVWGRAKPATSGADLRAALGNAARALLEYRLPTGTVLRDATAADLARAEAAYRAQADNMAWKARWLARVRAELEAKAPAATVGAALTEAQLRAAQEGTA
jgi:hypothetical protein